MKRFFKRHGLYFAWLIALVSSFCSLYASQILNYKPCVFCWYQRVMMFPLVIILGIAAFKSDKTVVSYVIAMPLIGAILAFVQTYFTYLPPTSSICTSECFEETAKVFGFIDFSFGSFLAFSMIFFFLLFSKKMKKRHL